jgi:mycothiol system anti-sigma-R factor
MSSENEHQDKPMNRPCSCMEIMQSVIDGEATEGQMDFFRQHIEECSSCSGHYRVETTLQELVRSKCCGDHPPADLAEKIKNEISKLS